MPRAPGTPNRKSAMLIMFDQMAADRKLAEKAERQARRLAEKEEARAARGCVVAARRQARLDAKEKARAEREARRLQAQEAKAAVKLAREQARLDRVAKRKQHRAEVLARIKELDARWRAYGRQRD